MTTLHPSFARQPVRENLRRFCANFFLRHKVLHTLALYGIGIAAVALTGVIRAWTAPLLGDHHRYVFFFVAIAVTAWCAGFWPSILAILLSYLTASWFLSPAREAFVFHEFIMDDFLGLAG